MGISKGRQMVTKEELKLWQEDVWKFFSSKPELLCALQDNNRVWNLDEMSVELGVAKKHVLTEHGTKILYNVSSSTCDHITCVLTVNAVGLMAPPRCFSELRGTWHKIILLLCPLKASQVHGASPPLRKVLSLQKLSSSCSRIL